MLATFLSPLAISALPLVPNFTFDGNPIEVTGNPFLNKPICICPNTTFLWSYEDSTDNDYNDAWGVGNITPIDPITNQVEVTIQYLGGLSTLHLSNWVVFADDTPGTLEILSVFNPIGSRTFPTSYLNNQFIMALWNPAHHILEFSGTQSTWVFQSSLPEPNPRNGVPEPTSTATLGLTLLLCSRLIKNRLDSRPHSCHNTTVPHKGNPNLSENLN